MTVTVTDEGSPVAADDTATITEDTTAATPIDAIGNDLQMRGSTGAPTLRVAEMTVSGT